MGECQSYNESRHNYKSNNNNQNQLNTESKNIIKDNCIIGH